MDSNQTFLKEKTQDAFATEKVDVVQNALLGDYTSAGVYVIKEEIINELVLLEKQKINSYGNSVFCKAFMEKYGQLTFELNFFKNTNANLSVAELFVLESVEKINGYIYNTIKTPIAKYTDTINPNFVFKALSMFNIMVNKGEGQKPLPQLELEEIQYIENRKKLLSLMDSVTEKDFDKSYKKYFLKRFQLLESEKGLFSKDVLDTFKTEYAKIENFFLKKDNKIRYKALNELLDNAIEAVSGLKTGYENEEKQFKTKLNSVTVSFVSDIEKSFEGALNHVVTQNKELSSIELKPTAAPMVRQMVDNLSEKTINPAPVESMIKEKTPKNENIKSPAQQVIEKNTQTPKNDPKEIKNADSETSQNDINELLKGDIHDQGTDLMYL